MKPQYSSIQIRGPESMKLFLDYHSKEHTVQLPEISRVLTKGTSVLTSSYVTFVVGLGSLVRTYFPITNSLVTSSVTG